MRARDIEVLRELEKQIERLRLREQQRPPRPSAAAPSDPNLSLFEPGWKSWCEQAGKN